MNPRQRNIPVTSKEEIEVQTDIKLIESYLLDSDRQQHQLPQGHSDILLSKVYTQSGLLRPFSDNHLLKEFARSVKELKDSEFNQGTFSRRLQMLEQQINGLMKRELLLSCGAEGSQTWNSYYSTLNQKEKTIIRMENQKIYSDLKIRRLRERVEELEREVEGLRSAVVNTQKIAEDNKLFTGFYERLNTIINNGKRKGIQFQQLLSEQVVPIFNDFNFNLNATTRTITRDVNATMRAVVTSLAREFDRLLKEQQFTEEKVSELASSLHINLKAVKGVEHLKELSERAIRTELAEGNYKNILSIFRNEIDVLKKETPSLKAAERIDLLLSRLDAEGVELVPCKGWMSLVQPEVRILEVGGQDTRLRELLGTLGAQFRRIYLAFPQLKTHISSNIIQILQSQVLSELIQGGSLERLQSIIIHQVDSIRVDNLYKYSSEKETQGSFHLRVLVKTLLEEIERIRKVHGIEIALDEGILGLLRQQAIEGIDAEQVIGLFRPPAKYVEVPIVVQKPVFQSRSYEKGVEIHTQSPLVLEQTKVEVVTINREVPVYIDRPVEATFTNHVAVSLQSQKAVPTTVNKQVIAERIVESSTQVPVVREKAVPVYQRQEVPVQIQVERVIESVQLRDVQKLVQTGGREYIQIEKIVQVPHYIYQTRQQIKEVQVRVPYIVRQPQYHEVERTVNHIIQKREVVNLKEEIAVEIKVPQVKIVDLVEYRDRVLVTNEYKEVVKEVPVIREKELLREVPRDIFIQRSHFIKGDQVEVIREVEVLVDRPIIHEIMTTRDVQIEKIVPLYITEQIPIITEVPTPYFTEKVKELQVEKVRLIPVKEEIVKQVRVDHPVPVVVEKEVVRIEKQIVEKIVEKIVEVPRVVEIEKIVEKIVVVPRIVQKIVEVPKIIERIVVVEQPILQIVEIPVPYIVIQEVEKIVEVVVEKIVVQYQKIIQVVEVQRIVERIIEREKAVEVQVQRRIPYEVVREVPVPTYRDRIEYQKVDIHETKVETIEVQVPLIVAEKVPFIVEKTVVTEHIIEKPVIEKSVTEKQVPIINEVEKLVVQQLVVQRAVESQVVREVPIETIVYRDVPSIVEVTRDKIVELTTTKEVPKEIYLQQEKIVHEIHEKLVEIPVNQIVFSPQVVEVPKVVHLTHYKEIAVDAPVREQRIKRDIFEQIKQVEVIKEVPVQVQICREKLKEVISQVKEFLTTEVVRELHSQVAVRSPPEQVMVQAPAQIKVETITESQRQVEVQDRIVERLVEKIVLMPQIVEVVRNIHHISEVGRLGVAIGVDVTEQTEKFQGISVELRKGLAELLATFRTNVGRQPDLRALITIIEKHLKLVDEWVKFPKLVEVPHEIIKEVEKERVVLVPTADKDKEAALSYILEKLVNELRRVRDSHKITLTLQQQLQRLFFFERKGDEGLQSKLTDLQQQLKKKYGKIGSWAQSNPFLVNSFLQDHFALRSLIQEANSHQLAQSKQIDSLRSKLQITSNKYNNLLCFNRKMFEDNNSLIRTLEKYRSTIDDQEYTESLTVHRKFYESIIEERHSVIFQTIKKTTEFKESFIVQHGQQSQDQVSSLISKLTRYENRNQELQARNKRLETELRKSEEETRIKASALLKLESEFQSRLRSREEVGKGSSPSREFNEENRKLQEKIRLLEREVTVQRTNAEKIKKELQRSGEMQRKEFQRDQQRREKEIRDSSERAKKELQKQVSKLRAEIDRLKKDRERLQAQSAEIKRRSSEEIKAIRETQMSSASDKYNQLLSENMELRRKYETVEGQFDKLRKGALENNSVNEREIARLRADNERFLQEKREGTRGGKKEGFLDLPQETQIINRNIQLEKKIKTLQADIEKLKTKDEASLVEIKSLRERVKKLEIQLEISRKEVETAQKSRLQATTYQSGFKQTVSVVENVESSVVRSPKSPGFKSGTYEKGFTSPLESSLSRQQREQFGSSSSRVSQSSEDQGLPAYYSSQMTVREFIDAKHGDEKERDMYVTLVMIKVIEKIEEQTQRGIHNSYSPSNIFLSNFNIKNLDKLVVKFGPHITNRQDRKDALYLAPELLAGNSPSRKSTVFCLGVILDELIHGSTYFKSLQDIQNMQNEFKVRGDKLNPILKNTLFEMMNKEPNKRLDIVEAKRRLSLQKYITSESRSSVTVTSRLARRTEE